jgi:hypothetical protein
MHQLIRVSAVAALLGAGVSSGGCMGWCDLYHETKPLGRAFEIQRIDMDYLYRRSDAPEHERFVTRIDEIGLTDRVVVVFEREPRGCSEVEDGLPCGRWWVGDLETGETKGPLTSKAFGALKQQRPDVAQVRVGAIDDVWKGL